MENWELSQLIRTKPPSCSWRWKKKCDQGFAPKEEKKQPKKQERISTISCKEKLFNLTAQMIVLHIHQPHFTCPSWERGEDLGGGSRDLLPIIRLLHYQWSQMVRVTARAGQERRRLAWLAKWTRLRTQSSGCTSSGFIYNKVDDICLTLQKTATVKPQAINGSPKG